MVKKMNKKNKDRLVIVLSIAVIFALVLIAMNLDKIFPAPETPDPLKYAQQSNNAMFAEMNAENPDAAVTIFEFSDFQCVWCRKVSSTVEKIVYEYGDRINFEFKHMAGHPSASLMAEAAECAKAQGKFWEYHHLLFEKGMRTETSLADYAEDVELDMERFDSCMMNGEMALKVENDFKEALSLGIRGTPTFVIDGKIMQGALSYEQFKQIIEEGLAEDE